MGCNNGKASAPGPQSDKPQQKLRDDDSDESKTLLLGNGDASNPVKVSTERSSSTNAEMSIVDNEPTQVQEATEIVPTSGSEKIEPNQIQEATGKDDPHSACHFSPLSIVGAWHYDGRQQGSKYEISIQGDTLQIEQVVDKETHRGMLIADGEWLVGVVRSVNALPGLQREVGSIRLQHRDGKLLSNFKVPGGSWGVDLMASKGASSSPMPSSPQASAQELEQQAEEKLRLLRRIQANAAPQSNGMQPYLPAITPEDVGRARDKLNDVASVRANSAGKLPSQDKVDDVAASLLKKRKDKEGMCCC